MLPSKLMVDGKMRTLLKEFETASSDSENMMRIFRLLAEFDIRPFLNDVHCPTLVMHSRDDHMVPFSSAHPLHEQIENAEFVELNEAGHIFFMHESEQILSKILEFGPTVYRRVKNQMDGFWRRFYSTISLTLRSFSPNLVIRNGVTKWISFTR